MRGGAERSWPSPREAKGKGADQPTAHAPENNGQRHGVLGAVSVVLLHETADDGAKESEAITGVVGLQASVARRVAARLPARPA